MSANDNVGVIAEKINAIEERLVEIEKCVREISASQKKDGNVIVKQQREHIADLKEAMRSITSMADKIKQDAG